MLSHPSTHYPSAHYGTTYIPPCKQLQRTPQNCRVQGDVCSHPAAPTNTMQFISLPSVRPTTLQTSAIGPRKDCIVSSYYMLYPAVIRPLYSHALTFTSLPKPPYLLRAPPPRLSPLHHLGGGGYDALTLQLYTLLKWHLFT